MKTFARFITLILLAVTTMTARSQETYMFHKNWYFSGMAGTTAFYGDMSDKHNRLFSDSPFSKFYYQDRGLALTLQFGKDINPYFGAGFVAGTADLHGTSQLLGMYMSSRIYDFGINAKFNALNIVLGPSRYRPLELYGVLGFSGISYRTSMRDIGTDTLIGINDPENPGVFSGTYLTSMSVLFSYGFGITYRVDDNVSLFFESTTQALMSDRLDAYISDKRKFEGYSRMSVGVTYHFDISPYAFQSAYPKYNGKSNDPAIKSYNKRKQVVMDTKASRQASKKRYDTSKGRTKLNLRNMFRRNKISFAK